MKLLYKKLYTGIVIIVLLLLSGSLAFAQQVTITGTITDAEDGTGLPGVNILVKDAGTPMGTVTDFDGNYKLNTTLGATIVFSFTGYDDKEVVVGSAGVYNVEMGIGDEMLNEVVVVGYGAVVKEDITGSVSKVSEEEFNKGVITSPERLLNGKVSGLQITSDGSPGGGSTIRIRGTTSLAANSSPLIVIDGVPVENDGLAGSRNITNFVNPADIADMTVLKDASAAAIYGARGANGVIIITTKSGKGKLKIDYTGALSVSTFIANPPMLSTSNFRKIISNEAPDKSDKLGEANTDWVKEVTQNAIGQQHNLAFSGGYKKLNYYISASHEDNRGVIRRDRYRNTKLTANLSTKLFDDNFTVNLRSKSSRNRNTFVPNVMNAALIFDPTRPVRVDDTLTSGFFQWSEALAVRNPVASIEFANQEGDGYRFLNNLELVYKLPFIPGLSLNSNISYDYRTGNYTNFTSPEIGFGAGSPNDGFLRTEKEIRTSTLIETYGKYVREFDNSKFDITLGHAYQDFIQDKEGLQGENLVKADNEFGYTIPEIEEEPDSTFLENRLISFFGRINYTLADKYLLTLSLRRDGSTRFGESNRWGYFPSAAIAWRVLQEDFAAGLRNTFSDLKLRFGYGATGTEEIRDYAYITLYTYGTGDAAYQFGDDYVNTLRAQGVDPDIKWESTVSLNAGIDFGFFNNRLTGTLDLYKKTTTDMLALVAAGAFTNLSDQIITNIAEMENRGVELALNSYVIDTESFDWEVGFTAAYNQNEITKLDNSNLPEFGGYDQGGINGDVGQTIQVFKVGEPIYAFKTYKHKYDENGKPETGDLIDVYEDINNDGIINEQDLVVGENPNPDFIFGLTNNFTYQNFDLALTLRANLGNHIYNNTASSTGYFNHLTASNVTNNIHESAIFNDFKKRQLKSDIYIEDGSFLKIDNISLGYSFNHFKSMRKLRLYATVQNLLTITNYSGIDPEAALAGNGIDNNVYPYSLTYLFGINASF